MHRQRTDVSARKEQGPHHKAIGRERDPRRRGTGRGVSSSEVERGLVLERIEHLVTQRTREPVPHQTGPHGAATAVPKQNMLAPRQRHWANESLRSFVVRHVALVARCYALVACR